MLQDMADVAFSDGYDGLAVMSAVGVAVIHFMLYNLLTCSINSARPVMTTTATTTITTTKIIIIIIIISFQWSTGYWFSVTSSRFIAWSSGEGYEAEEFNR
jgi:uncharacterized membrane protein